MFDRNFCVGFFPHKTLFVVLIMTPIIEFKNVSKSFDDKHVLDNVSFQAFEGETFCIIGGSGVGKSVALKLLLRLDPVDSGDILFRDKSILSLDETEINDIRRHFGMVFQGSALFDSMSVFDNLAYPLLEMRQFNDDEIESRILEKLEVVGMADAVNLFPSDLSGGMRRRVGLARALVTNPQVILYDEPTTGLDPANVNRIDLLILRLQHKYNATSIVVTHNMESVYRIADRVALLHDRHFVFVGTLQEFKESSNPLVQQFVRGELGHE